MQKRNWKALAPIGVFLFMYLGLGLLFEYRLMIPMGFYNIPIVVCFLVALLVACLQNRSLNFNDKMKLMAKGVGDPNIITMVLIFMAAGMFVGVVGRSSAESVAYFLLSVIPPKFAIMVLFVVSCFVSTAMGTSVGTITLITPIGLAVANSAGFDVPLCIGAVMGGAMFGDNLSFISDTTIAACNGQGCAMKEKFYANFGIALPAARATLVVILFCSMGNAPRFLLKVIYRSFISFVPRIGTSLCAMIFFIRFIKSALSIMTILLQPLQRILISAPTRMTVHLSLPQGCVFRI